MRLDNPQLKKAVFGDDLEAYCALRRAGLSSDEAKKRLRKQKNDTR